MSRRKKSKSKDELFAENQYLRKGNVATTVSSVLNNLMKYGMFCFISYCVYLSISSLAGETTTTDIGLEILSDISVSQIISIMAAGGTTAWGLGERQLRKNSVKSMEQRIKELEAMIDPERSSSGLLAGGSTNPKDE